MVTSSGVDVLGVLVDVLGDDEIVPVVKKLKKYDKLITENLLAHPEDASILKKYFSYYQPTTTKLISKYAELSGISNPTTVVQKTKREIASALNNMVEICEEFINAMYSNDAVDISAELKVLEEMMSSDLDPLLIAFRNGNYEKEVK